MRLLFAEWKRFFARRFTRIMLLVVLVLLTIVAVGVGHASHKLDATAHATAHTRMLQAAAQQSQQIADCNAANANGAAPADSPYFLPPGSTCDDFFGGYTPRESDFLPESWVFADKANDMILLFGGVLALFGFAVGASFVGAEWSSGGMANLLLWRPRRLALLGTKLAALLVSVFASGVVLGAVWVGELCALAVLRGSFGHVTSGQITSLFIAGGRSMTLGLAAAAIGFAVASIGRSTATALGLGIGYIIVVEAGGTFILGAMNVTRPERFLLSHYVEAWLFKSQKLSGPEICTSSGPFGESCQSGPDWFMRMHSAAELGAIIVAILLAWAFLSFRRRDVS